MLLILLLSRVCGAEAGGGEEDGAGGIGVGSMEEETDLAHFLVLSLVSIDVRPPTGADGWTPKPVLSDVLSDTLWIRTWSGMLPRMRNLKLRRSAALRTQLRAFKAQG